MSDDGHDNLILTLDTGDGGASVLTFEGVYADGTTDEVAAVVFADGTSVPLDQITTTPVGDGIVTGTAATDLIDGTYTDSDSDAVSDGDDQVVALAGDDTIAGGLGNDTLDGGDGSDEVLLSGTALDFAFAHDGVLTVTDINTADGTDEGTDTLINVERVRFSDGSTAQITMVSTGLMVTMYASGSAQAIARTVFDVNNAYAWSDYTQAFDAAGLRTAQTNTYDDGRVAETMFASGVRQTTVITDAQDAFIWSTVEQTFDAAGLRSEQTNTYDDGRVLERTFVNGISSMDVMTDVADVYSWASYTDTYDPAGERVQRVMIYDDGSEVVTNYLDLVLG